MSEGAWQVGASATIGDLMWRFLGRVACGLACGLWPQVRENTVGEELLKAGADSDSEWTEASDDDECDEDEEPAAKAPAAKDKAAAKPAAAAAPAKRA